MRGDRCLVRDTLTSKRDLYDNAICLGGTTLRFRLLT
jgi:hypothetical protein